MANTPTNTASPLQCATRVVAIASLVAAVQVGSPSYSYAQQTADELKRLTLEELAQIDVTGTSRVPTTAWETPAAIYVFTQEDIRRSGATTLPEVLRLVPGVQVSRIDSGHWAVGIRGFANQFSKSVLVLIDGRSVYTPLFAGVYWQLQDTVLEDIDRIEVIRGPGGTVWGSNAVNGVINIITKSARDTTGVLISGTTGATSFGRGVGEARVGTAMNAGAIRVYGKGFSRGPQDHPTTPDYDTWSGGQGGFRADWKHGARDTFTLQGDVFRSNNGTQTQIASFTLPLSTVVYDDINYTGANVLARWQRQFAPSSGITLQAYWNHLGQSGPQLQDVQDTIDVDFVQQLPLPGNHVVFGGGARITPDRFTQVASTTTFSPADFTYKLYSAFAQDEIRLPKRLTLTVGSKFEHNSYTGLEVQPTARLLWNQPDRQSAWVAVTRAVRSPSRLDRDFSLFLLARTVPPIVYADVVGNSNFDSETVVGSEAGYRVLAGKTLAVDVATFHNRYNGLVGLGNTTIAPVSGPGVPHLVGTLPWTNAVDGTTDGVEIAPDVRPVTWWRIRGSYSYLHLDLHTRAGLTDLSAERTYLGSSPHHMVTVISELTFPHGVQFDQIYRHVSELPAQLVPAYSTADVRLAWRATRALEISGGGRNLLDDSHPEFGGLPSGLVGIRRTVYLQVRWIR